MTDVIPDGALIPEPLYREITGLVPVPCVDLVVVRAAGGEPEILIIKRAIEPDLGKWCIVGGRVLGGREIQPERLSGAIQRQARRELGVEVRVIAPWDEHHPAVVFDDPDCDPAKYPIVLVYPVEVVRGEVATGPESSEVHWCPYGELPKEMGFTHRAEIDAVIAALSEQEWPATQNSS